MKIVSLEIKKINIGRFFPKDSEVELCIGFNDGTDKEVRKEVNFSDPENAAESILTGLRKMERNLHKDSENESITIENFVNIVIEDEDKLLEEISNFIQKVGIKINEINGKKEAEGYLDHIRELKNMKLELQ